MGCSYVLRNSPESVVRLEEIDKDLSAHQEKVRNIQKNDAESQRKSSENLSNKLVNMEDEFKVEEVVKMEPGEEIEMEPGEEIEKSCRECGKTFESDKTLSYHNRAIHGTIYLLPCPIWGKSVSSKQSLDNHMRTHTGEKPYICQDCGERFSDRSGLNCHKAVHDENRKMYRCEFSDDQV